MAKDDQRRKKFWEDEEEDTDFLPSAKPGAVPPRPGVPAGPAAAKPNDARDLDRLIQEARVLMDQIHQLYLMFLSGIERRPPVEKAKQLETRVAELQRIAGTASASRFKVGQFVALYQTTRELWERKMREREKG